MKATRNLDRAFWAIVAITLLAFALRAFRLAEESLWSDEIFVVRFTALPLSQMWAALAHAEPHPPLYYTLLHFWRLVAGSSEEALRYPSLFFSVLCIPAMYLLGRSLFRPAAGLLGAFIFAINPFQLWYAQEARMYTIPVAGTVLAVYLLQRALREDRRRWWLGYFLAAALGLGAHYYTFLALAAANLVALWPIWRHPRLLRGWLAANAALGGLLAVWVGYIWHIVTVYPGWMKKTDLTDILWRSVVAFSVGTSFPPEQMNAAGLAFAALFVVCASIACWRPPHGYYSCVLLLACAVFPLVASYCLQELLRRPIYHERYVIVAAPTAYLIVGAALARPQGWGRAISVLVAVAIALASGVSLHNHFFDPRFAKGEMREVTRYLEARAGQNDVILAVEARDQIYEYYALQPLPRVVVGDLAGLQRDLPELLRRYERIWFLPYFNLETDIYPERWLSEHAYLVEHRWFGSGRLLWYSRPTEPVVLAPRSATFANGVTLRGAGIWPSTPEPGQVVHVALSWATERAQPADLKASLRLRDAKGRAFAQADREVADRFRPTSTWSPGQPTVAHMGLAVPVDTPPGTYHLQAILYDGGPIFYREGDKGGAEVPLGQVQVAPPGRRWSPAAAGLPEREVARFGSVARLLAADLSPRTYVAGDTLPLTLHWQALEPDGANYDVALQLADSAGGAVSDQARPPVDGAFPTGRWEPGQLVRDPQEVRLPRSLPAGTYSLRLSLVPTQGAAPPWEPFVLGRVQVQARPANFTVPSMGHERHATLNDRAELLGYDLDPAEVSAGPAIRLTLYWRALADIEQNYKVFAHLVGPDGQLWGQHDSPPCNERCPTGQWTRGEVLRDEHTIAVKAGAPVGQYLLLAGMYDPQSGQRLPAAGEAARPGEHSIEVGPVAVR